MKIQLAGWPTYSEAILAETPKWGEFFETSDGAAMEWNCDMASGEWGYCEM